MSESKIASVPTRDAKLSGLNLTMPFGVFKAVSKSWNVVLGISGAIAFVLLWHFATLMEVAPERIFPSPFHVGETLLSMLANGFWQDILQSVYRIAASFFFAALIAFPIGIAIGAFPAISAALSPLVSGFRYLPAPAFIPLLLMWLGAGDLQKIVFLILGVIWFLITLIADHVRATPRELVDTARTMGASNRQLVWTVVAPASYPRIWEALRQMLAVSWTYLVIAEIVAATDGIGAAMMRAQRFIRVDEVMACIVTIGLLGVAFDLLFRLAGRALFKYEQVARH